MFTQYRYRSQFKETPSSRWLDTIAQWNHFDDAVTDICQMSLRTGLNFPFRRLIDTYGNNRVVAGWYKGKRIF
jgi:hypothetical protein